MTIIDASNQMPTEPSYHSKGRTDTGLTCMLKCVCITHENLVQWLSQVPLSVAMQSVIALQWPWNSSGWLNCGASYKRSGRTIIIMT